MDLVVLFQTIIKFGSSITLNNAKYMDRNEFNSNSYINNLIFLGKLNQVK